MRLSALKFNCVLGIQFGVLFGVPKSTNAVEVTCSHRCSSSQWIYAYHTVVQLRDPATWGNAGSPSTAIHRRRGALRCYPHTLLK